MTVKALVTGLLFGAAGAVLASSQPAQRMEVTTSARAGDVCPPFFLRDEAGNVINPVAGENADKPYSPKHTCGACHDYEKITQGFHFQQGADEQRPGVLGERCQWVSSPGNFGGTWCSPAPLYSYLSPKHNDDPHLIDMTSLDFITRGCGKCHPGGGPLEYDRDGKRYDQWMADPASGFTPDGENELDGDYYKARWSESGVLEADCLLCHLPEYDFGARNQQIDQLNFRWAPVAAAGLARIDGSISKDEAVTVTYDASKFDADGKLSPHIVREPRNETCLQCHAKPGWKKRGANFRARTDVHLAAGLRCVDCHPAGSQAADPRINEREMHQFAKGDDPGGQVRNDLDNTVRDCDSCHTSGEFGAPIATHEGLPPLHLDKIACQTCHIPWRHVKAAQAQLADVFNPGAKIPTKGKHLWTFYGPDMKYWNHYGDLEMMGYDDKPTDMFRPVLARYKGKIYPVNRVHSSWPGIEVEGQPGLMQPRMSDIYTMWKAHRDDPAQHADLATITDDNGDEVIEVNRPEEIDALIAAITRHLTTIGYPLEGKRVVWVSDDRVYRSGTEYRTIPIEPWEASAYGNMHKYNHDVMPARAALGAKGCTECHSPGSEMFFASVIDRPFDENAQAVTVPQFELLGLSRSAVTLGVFRETYLKPAIYLLWLVVVALAAGWGVGRLAEGSKHARATRWLVTIVIVIGLLPLLLQEELREYALPSRAWLDNHHFLASTAIMALGLVSIVVGMRYRSGHGRGGATVIRRLAPVAAMLLIIAAASGLLMALRISALDVLSRYAYTVFDLALVGVLLSALTVLTAEALRRPAEECAME